TALRQRDETASTGSFDHAARGPGEMSQTLINDRLSGQRRVDSGEIKFGSRKRPRTANAQCLRGAAVARIDIRNCELKVPQPPGEFHHFAFAPEEFSDVVLGIYPLRFFVNVVEMPRGFFLGQVEAGH